MDTVHSARGPTTGIACAASDIYEPRFVARLFDEMSKSYGRTNYFSSFGFCDRWRRQCVEALRIEPGMVILDLMTGMGECCRLLSKQIGEGRLLALDLSHEMCRRAQRNALRQEKTCMTVWRGDALEPSLPDGCVDAIVASFGLKTFSEEQLRRLAWQVYRLLKPGGSFSFVEIAVPARPVIRTPYLWYLRWCIPMVGRVFLGNPDNYRMLAVYTQQFSEGAVVTQILEEAGLTVRADDLFFGCARRFVGSKPLEPPRTRPNDHG